MKQAKHRDLWLFGNYYETTEYATVYVGDQHHYVLWSGYSDTEGND